MSLLKDRRNNALNLKYEVKKVETQPKPAVEVRPVKPKMNKSEKVEHEKNEKLESINFIIKNINEPEKNLNAKVLLEILNSFVDKYYPDF